MIDPVVYFLQSIHIIDHSYWFTYMTHSCISNIKPIWSCMHDFFMCFWIYFMSILLITFVSVFIRELGSEIFLLSSYCLILWWGYCSACCVVTRPVEEICGSSVPRVVIVGSAVCTTTIQGRCGALCWFSGDWG